MKQQARTTRDVTVRAASVLALIAIAGCGTAAATGDGPAILREPTGTTTQAIEATEPTQATEPIEVEPTVSTAITTVPATEPIAAEATTPDLAAPDATTPDVTTPDPTTPDVTTPDVTTPDAANPDAANEVAAADSADDLVFVTDDPSFDVEPLKPFEVGAAETRPADLDDTGAPQPTGWSAFDAALADELIRNGNTAASVAVSIDGDIVHTAAFGERAPLFSAESTRPTDRFRIASISKPITAITLLRLVEQGVVGLDEPVGQLVADHLGITPSNGAAAITVRRLLNHTSGFGKYDYEFFRKGTDSCDAAARVGMRRGAGGGGYRYSNMNYCVAGILIESLTGTSYEQAAFEQVLTPLGLSRMRIANTFDPGPGEVLHATTPNRNYMETLGAAGSWIATPKDLVTILDSLDLSTPGFKPLSAETLELMKTPVGGQPGQRGYGLGLISYGPGRYGHTGTIENTHAMAMNRGDGVTWSITVAGPYPDSTPRLESIINRAFETAGFISG